jgi:hypothetical protein
VKTAVAKDVDCIALLASHVRRRERTGAERCRLFQIRVNFPNLFLPTFYPIGIDIHLLQTQINRSATNKIF